MGEDDADLPFDETSQPMDVDEHQLVINPEDNCLCNSARCQEFSLSSQLDVILDPTFIFTSPKQPERLWPLLALGFSEPEAYVAKLNEYRNESHCGLAWPPGYVAYRCRTCSEALTMALCAECFRAGNHEGHDYNMFKSRSGGACDCGFSIMKSSGHCSNHGENAKALRSNEPVPEGYICIPKRAMPRMLSRLVIQLRRQAVAQTNETDIYLDTLTQIANSSAILKEIMIQTLLSEEAYTSQIRLLSNHKDARFARVTQESQKILKRERKKLKAFKIPSRWPVPNDRILPAFCDKRPHKTFLEELTFWMVVFEFHQKLVCFLLSFLMDSEYKEVYGRLFVNYYPNIAMCLTTSALDRRQQQVETFEHLSRRILQVSVQIYNDAELTRKVCDDELTLHTIIYCIRIMIEGSQADGIFSQLVPNPLSPTHRGSTQTKVVSCDEPILRDRQLASFTEDLLATLDFDHETKRLLSDQDLLDVWLGMLSYFQTMSPYRRELYEHAPYETGPRLSVFMIESEFCLVPLWTMLVHLKDQQTVEYTSGLMKSIHATLANWMHTMSIGPHSKLNAYMMSFHIPLHRMLAATIRHMIYEQGMPEEQVYAILCENQQTLGSRFSYRSAHGSRVTIKIDDFLKMLLLHPLQALTLYHQTRSGMWTRNGLLIVNQAVTYVHCAYCYSIIDMDMFLLRYCGSRLKPDVFLKTFLQRFSAWHCLSFTCGPIFSDTPSDTLRVHYYFNIQPEQITQLVESCLVTLIELLTLGNHCNVSEREQMRSELISLISVADRPYSFLVDMLPTITEQHRNEEMFDSLLEELTDYKPASHGASGSLQQGCYTLKSSVWENDYNPIHVLYRYYQRRDYQQSLERFFQNAKLKGKLNRRHHSSALWPPLKVPEKIANFGPIDLSPLIGCQTLLGVVFSIIYKCTYVEDMPDTMMAYAIHLLELSIRRQLEDTSVSSLDTDDAMDCETTAPTTKADGNVNPPTPPREPKRNANFTGRYSYRELISYYENMPKEEALLKGRTIYSLFKENPKTDSELALYDNVKFFPFVKHALDLAFDTTWFPFESVVDNCLVHIETVHSLPRDEFDAMIQCGGNNEKMSDTSAEFAYTGEESLFSGGTSNTRHSNSEQRTPEQHFPDMSASSSTRSTESQTGTWSNLIGIEMEEVDDIEIDEGQVDGDNLGRGLDADEDDEDDNSSDDEDPSNWSSGGRSSLATPTTSDQDDDDFERESDEALTLLEAHVRAQSSSRNESSSQSGVIPPGSGPQSSTTTTGGSVPAIATSSPVAALELPVSSGGTGPSAAAASPATTNNYDANVEWASHGSSFRAGAPSANNEISSRGSGQSGSGQTGANSATTANNNNNRPGGPRDGSEFLLSWEDCMAAAVAHVRQQQQLQQRAPPGADNSTPASIIHHDGGEPPQQQPPPPATSQAPRTGPDLSEAHSWPVAVENNPVQLAGSPEDQQQLIDSIPARRSNSRRSVASGQDLRMAQLLDLAREHSRHQQQHQPTQAQNLITERRAILDSEPRPMITNPPQPLALEAAAAAAATAWGATPAPSALRLSATDANQPGVGTNQEEPSRREGEQEARADALLASGSSRLTSSVGIVSFAPGELATSLVEPRAGQAPQASARESASERSLSEVDIQARFMGFFQSDAVSRLSSRIFRPRQTARRGHYRGAYLAEPYNAYNNQNNTPATVAAAAAAAAASANNNNNNSTTNNNNNNNSSNNNNNPEGDGSVQELVRRSVAVVPAITDAVRTTARATGLGLGLSTAVTRQLRPGQSENLATGASGTPGGQARSELLNDLSRTTATPRRNDRAAARGNPAALYSYFDPVRREARRARQEAREAIADRYVAMRHARRSTQLQQPQNQQRALQQSPHNHQACLSSARSHRGHHHHHHGQQQDQRGSSSRRLRKEHRQHHGESILTLLLRLHAKYSQHPRSYQFSEQRAQTNLDSRERRRIGDGAHFVTIALDLICASDVRRMRPRVEHLMELIWPKPASERATAAAGVPAETSASNEKSSPGLAGSVKSEFAPRGEKRPDCGYGGGERGANDLRANQSDDREIDMKSGASVVSPPPPPPPAVVVVAEQSRTSTTPSFGLNLSGARQEHSAADNNLAACSTSVASLTPDEKRRRAKERQSRLMAEFANKQRAFLEKYTATSASGAGGTGASGPTLTGGAANKASASLSPQDGAHASTSTTRAHSSSSAQKYANLATTAAAAGTAGAGSTMHPNGARPGDEQPINLSSKSTGDEDRERAGRLGATAGQGLGAKLDGDPRDASDSAENGPQPRGDDCEMQTEETNPDEQQDHRHHYECCICGVEGPSDLTNPLGQVVLLQSTSVFGHSHLRPRSERQLPCDETERFREETYAKYLQLRIDILCDHFTESSWLDSINIGAEGGVHVQSCGHYLHIECHQSYIRSLDQEDRLRSRAESDEFQCPVCRQLANSVLPILDDNFFADGPSAVPSRTMQAGRYGQQSRKDMPRLQGAGGKQALPAAPASDPARESPSGGGPFALPSSCAPSQGASSSPADGGQPGAQAESLDDQIAQVGLQLRHRQAPNQRELQSSAVFCSHLTKATGPQYRLVRTQASMHSLFLFLSSIARTNLETGLIVQSIKRRAAAKSAANSKQSGPRRQEQQDQGNEDQEDKRQSTSHELPDEQRADNSDAQKRTCFQLLFHVLALNARTLIKDQWFTYDQIWHHLTHCVDDTNRLGLRAQDNEVPLLLRDPIAMLLQFLFTIGPTSASSSASGPGTRAALGLANFTCLVKILFNLTVIQSVALVLSYVKSEFEASSSASSSSSSSNLGEPSRANTPSGPTSASDKSGTQRRASTTTAARSTRLEQEQDRNRRMETAEAFRGPGTEGAPDCEPDQDFSCKRNKQQQQPASPATQPSRERKQAEEQRRAVGCLLSDVWTCLSPLLAPNIEQPLMNSVVRTCWPRHFASERRQRGHTPAQQPPAWPPASEGRDFPPSSSDGTGPAGASGAKPPGGSPKGLGFVENKVKLACLPFLRAAAFLKEHLYARPSPVLVWDLDENSLSSQPAAVDEDFNRLVEYLELRSSSGAANLSSASARRGDDAPEGAELRDEGERGDGPCAAGSQQQRGRRARGSQATTISLSETLNWPSLAGGSSSSSGGNLIASWANELLRFAHSFSIAARTLLVCRPLAWYRPGLMQLPHAFDDIFMFYYRRKCSLCQQVPKDVAVCLVCGAPICFRVSCCKDRSRSRQVHSQHCGANTAVFLAVHTSAIVVIRGSRACVWGSVYLDAHDEEDNGLQRGKPLYLVPARFELLETQWLTHSFDHTCGKRWIYLQETQ